MAKHLKKYRSTKKRLKKRSGQAQTQERFYPCTVVPDAIFRHGCVVEMYLGDKLISRYEEVEPWQTAFMMRTGQDKGGVQMADTYCKYNNGNTKKTIIGPIFAGSGGTCAVTT